MTFITGTNLAVLVILILLVIALLTFGIWCFRRACRIRQDTEKEAAEGKTAEMIKADWELW